jgi:hypothetical protein
MKIENLFHMVSNCGDFFGSENREFMTEYYSFRIFYQMAKVFHRKKLSMQHQEHNPQ